MRSRLVLICCCLFFGFGCQQAKRQAIPEKKMIDILIDVHLIEASLLGYSNEQKDSLTQLYYHQIYEIHSISEEEFLSEIKYLKRHPKYLGQIYEQVLEEIDKREAELK